MRTNHILSIVGALAAGALAVSLGLPTVARAGGDAAAGKGKSLACAACHVSDAASDDTPHLAGQRATYIAKQLKAFKAGDRKNVVMNGITAALNEADIDNLSAFWSSQATGSDTTVTPELAAIRKFKMAFPKDFPKGFTLYSTVNKEGKNAVAKQYINAAGLAAAKAGKPLPSGTIIMVVNYAAKLDPDKKPVVDKDGSWVTDKLLGYEGMEMRTGWGKDIPEPLRNLDWGYGLFNDAKALRPEVNHAVCLACHVPAASTGYVFGIKKIETAAHAK
jgi:cytochrome c553